MAEFLYYIACPHCVETIALLETSLAEIVRCRRESTTGEPFLTFVCQECKAAFQYDYQHRATAGLIDEGPLTAKLRTQKCYSVSTQCGDNNCESRVELIAIRSAQTTTDMYIEERPTWNVGSVECAKGHPLLPPPDSKKSR